MRKKIDSARWFIESDTSAQRDSAGGDGGDMARHLGGLHHSGDATWLQWRNDFEMLAELASLIYPETVSRVVNISTCRPR